MKDYFRLARIPTENLLRSILLSAIGKERFNAFAGEHGQLTDWEQIQVSSALIRSGIDAPLVIWTGDETFKSLHRKLVAHNVARAIART